MLDTLRHIVEDVSNASDLEDALSKIVTGVKAALSLDVDARPPGDLSRTVACDGARECWSYPRVARMYDNLHPAVLKAIHDTLVAGTEVGKPVSLCGDMAGDTFGLVLLLGMGFKSLSMGASNLGRAKRIIRALPQKRASAVFHRALMMEDAGSVRDLVGEELEHARLGELLPPSQT